MLVRVLRPWDENVKRQVRSPKVYFRDSGLAHTLLGIDSRVDLLRNPRVGATWEGVVIEACIRQIGDDMTPYFWRTSNGNELDLLLVRGDRRIGIEVKRADAPRITPSMRAALADLHLDRLTVNYPGRQWYALPSDRRRACRRAGRQSSPGFRAGVALDSCSRRRQDQRTRDSFLVFRSRVHMTTSPPQQSIVARTRPLRALSHRALHHSSSSSMRRDSCCDRSSG